MAVRLSEIVARFGGELVGAGDTVINRIAPLDQAGPGDLAFLSNPKYRRQVEQSHAAAIIMVPSAAVDGRVAIHTSQPYLYYARVAQWLSPPFDPGPGIHESAVVEGSCSESASVGANAYVAPGATIGHNVVLGANTSIGRGVTVGEGSRIAANVSIADGCHIGARAVIHSGAVVGSDGFGFARDETGAWVKIPQVGRVLIGDDRILERPKRPAAIVVRREDVVDITLQELNRLLDEQSKAHRTLVVDGELHDAVI